MKQISSENSPENKNLNPHSINHIGNISKSNEKKQNYEQPNKEDLEKLEKNEPPPKKSSLEFAVKREEIMTKFQSNFINIYEGRPLNPPGVNGFSTFSPLQPENNREFTEEKFPNLLGDSDLKDTLEERPESNSKNIKKEKIKTLLGDIERKKKRRMEIEEKTKSRNVMQRNCMNSKIIYKDEQVFKRFFLQNFRYFGGL